MRCFQIIYLAVLVIGVFFFDSVSAHESCCKHKLGGNQPKIDGFIVDVTDTAPEEFDGHPRWVVDKEDEKPDYWDDEDDGIWEPRRILNPQYAWKPRMIPNPEYVPPPTYWDKLVVELKASIPWVTLGLLVTGALTVVSLPMESLKSYLEGDGPLSAIQAAILGLATPLCSCGALPIASGLVSQGVPLESVLVFLTASQSAGLDSAAITWGLLGPTAVLARLAGAILLAVAAGMVVGGRKKNNGMNGSSSVSDDCCKPKTVSTSSASILDSIVETTTEVLPTVFLGLATSTAVLHYLPSLIRFDDMDENSQSSFLTRLSVLASALPLQLCEHTTVTLAAAIQKAGGSAGLAFSFLLSAPATNMPTMLLLLQHGGVTSVLRAVVALCVVALSLSYAVDGSGVDLLADKDIGGMADLPEWYVAVSPWLAGGLFLVGTVQRLSSSTSHGTSSDCCSPPESQVASTSCCDSSTPKAKAE